MLGVCSRSFAGTAATASLLVKPMLHCMMAPVLIPRTLVRSNGGRALHTTTAAALANTTTRPPACCSPHFQALRSRFKQQQQQSPHALPSDRRGFSWTSWRRGPRPYYGGRGPSYTGGRTQSSYSVSSLRQRIDRLPHNVILYAIIGERSGTVNATRPQSAHRINAGLNVAVFLMWQYGYSVLQQFRDPSYLRFMTNNFTSSWRNIQSGRL